MSDPSIDLQRAIAALRLARSKIEALERARHEPIAVVAMACRFPGGDGPEAFWQLLRDGREAITEVPPERWRLADYYDPNPHALGRTHSRHGGFLPGVFEFDPERFGISQTEAEAMDPQQRLLLEVAAEAFERAGDATLEGSNTGVFVGISTHDNAQRALRDDAPELVGVHTGTGNAFSTAAGRVAYVFGLHGPCLALDTACSSSLVAAHFACESLRAGECDRALVAGVNVLMAPAITVYFSRLGVLAPDGHCRSFDADARGYVRSEGCGALVLRRLHDAERDGDPIIGVIRGSAVNANGRGNGLTAPSRAAQVAVIRRALMTAGIEPTQVGYIEAFGSGTPQGDAVELRALGDVFAGRPAGDLPIASVKSNIGHAEAASGTASLIKALLCLQHAQLPSSLHLDRPNPAIADGESPVRVLQALEAFAAERSRIVGVSGFGFGGTNAHLVLESAPSRISTSQPGPHLLTLSARTAAALERRRADLIALLEDRPDMSIASLSRGCAAVRSYTHRLALACDDLETALLRLRSGEFHRGQVAPVALSVTSDAPLTNDRTSALDRIAARYVEGVEPPWHELLEPGPRESLPPHPFTRRHMACLPVRSPHPSEAPPPSSSQSLVAELLAQTLPRRRDRIAQWLTSKLDALDHGGTRHGSSPPAALGLDSIAVVDLIQSIQRELELQIYPEELLGAGSITALADLLANEVGRHHAGAREPATAPDFERTAARRHIAAHTGTIALASAAPPTDRETNHKLASALFLLSAPRCGSTLLRAMLAGHPRLFAPPELHLLGHEDMAAWHRELAPRMMHLGLLQALLGLGLDSTVANAKLESWIETATPTAAVHAELQALAGTRRLVDKSPGHALDPRALARAEALFDTPRYVILTRHPYAAIESFVRLRMSQLFGAGGLDPQLVAEAVWERSYANLESFAAEIGPGRCHRLSFEQLVSDPEPTLQRLCEFLGIEFDAAMLAPHDGNRMVDGARRAIGFIGDPNFASRSRIDPALGEAWKDVRLPWRLAPETAALARRLGYETPAEPEDRVDDPIADATLPARFEVAPARVRGPDDEVLLTGATGFLGVHLAAEILTQTEHPLRCLVRAQSPAAALQRVRAAMLEHGVWRAEWHARLHAEPADLAAPRLGLSSDRWDALARGSCAIFHNGAQVNFGLPYAALRGSNIEGTLWALRLAAHDHQKPLHFVSSKGVFHGEVYPGDTTILEDEPVRPPLGSLAYQQSKWAAEQLVIAARALGLSTTVYRPGRIGGHSHTGRINPDDLVYRILRACMQVGSIPDVPVQLEITPVDHVAAAIVRISSNSSASGRAYNLAHPRPIAMLELRDALARSGLPLALSSYASWRAAVLARPDSPMSSLRSLLGEQPPSRLDDTRLDATNTRTNDPSWSPPPVIEQLLIDVAFMRGAGLLEEPSS
jgi:thioester reductase-like protein